MTDLSTDERNVDHWRAGCECARAGLCYRCRAAAEIERLERENARLKRYLLGVPQLRTDDVSPNSTEKNDGNKS